MQKDKIDFVNTIKCLNSSNIKYIIAGDEDQSYKEELKQLVVELGLESNVLFLGYIHENQKRLLYFNLPDSLD